MKVLERYKNGNASVTIWSDGTREIEFPDGEEINLDFPLSIDLCITKYCNRGCLFCYNNSGVNGKHGDIMNLPIIDSLPRGVEVCLGGGSATTHPDLKPFLKKLKAKGVIANMTVSQGEFIDNLALINDLIENDLIHGLGISYKEPNNQLWKLIAENKDCVVHLIAGVHTKEVFDYLSKFGLKVLILGYKEIGRGLFYYDALKEQVDKNIQWLKDNLESYIDKFEVVSFDNLALKQLSPERLVTPEKWNELYQGDDGTISCYIDAVDKTIHISSLDQRGFDVSDDIKSDFNKIKKMKRGNEND